jgi:hypothetical protein
VSSSVPVTGWCRAAHQPAINVTAVSRQLAAAALQSAL